MLKVDMLPINGGERVVIEAQGSAIEITSNVARLINAVYLQMKESSEFLALAFRAAIEALVNDKDTPLWSDDACDRIGVGICIEMPGKKKED